MSAPTEAASRRIDALGIPDMSSSVKRAAGALSLLVFTMPGICVAADNGSAPPTTTASPPATSEPSIAPTGDEHRNSNADTSAMTAGTSNGPKTFTFFGKNKLACFDAPGFAPGAILYENDGPGDLTIGTTIKVVIQPTGKIISYVLPYDVPAKSGVILYDAYPPDSTTAVVTCTVTASHPARHMTKPKP
jgi:hypothetical protein